MEIQSWYPDDYRQALSNTFTEQEIDALLAKPGCSFRFVYGVLMLPTALKYHIDADQSVDISRNMTQARLAGYQLYSIAEAGPPVMAPSSNPRASVDGMLIFGLTESQRNFVYQLESGLMDLLSVDVEICVCDVQGIRSLRTVEPVGAFAWRGSKEGLISLDSTAWPVDNFLESSFYRNLERSQKATSTAAQKAVHTERKGGGKIVPG